MNFEYTIPVALAALMVIVLLIVLIPPKVDADRHQDENDHGDDGPRDNNGTDIRQNRDERHQAALVPADNNSNGQSKKQDESDDATQKEVREFTEPPLPEPPATVQVADLAQAAFMTGEGADQPLSQRDPGHVVSPIKIARGAETIAKARDRVPIPPAPDTADRDDRKPEVAAPTVDLDLPDIEPDTRDVDARPVRKREPIEFSVFAPAVVSKDVSFPIDVNIDFYKDDEGLAGAESTFDSLVLEIENGSLIDLSLESDDLEIDAPHQTLHWIGRRLTAVFIVRMAKERPADLSTELQCSMHVSINGCPLGHIPFTLEIGKSDTSKIQLQDFSAQELIREIGKLSLEGRGKGALRYRDVFLSYTDDDLNRVTYIADGLEFGGVARIRTHLTVSPTGEDWEKIVGPEIAQCEAVLLCWSANAAGPSGQGTEGIQLEIDLALKQEKLRRSFRLVPMMLGNEFVPLPDKIRRRTATTQYFFVRRPE